MNDFIGKTCKVTVKHEEYNGKTNARVSEAGSKSNYTGCNHVFKESQNTSTDYIRLLSVDNEDIPF